MRYKLAKSLSKFENTEILVYKNISIPNVHSSLFVKKQKLCKFYNNVFESIIVFDEDFKKYKVVIHDCTHPVKGIVYDKSEELNFIVEQFNFKLLNHPTDLLDPFIPITEIYFSGNKFLPIELSKTFPLPLFYAEETKVSDNLFEKLGKIVQKGKYYIEKDKSLKDKYVQQNLFENTKDTDKGKGLTKAYERRNDGNITSITHQDVWDLLYPILMPPLDYEFSDDLVFGELYDFQKVGVKFLISNKSALLADEMGTGKTVMSVVAMRALFKKAFIRKGLIICPVSILSVWDEHINDWAPDLSFTVVRGTKEIRENDWKYPAHLYVTTYDTIRNDFLNSNCTNKIISEDAINEYDFVLIDEAQYIKNPKSGRSKALKIINADQRWALTGTPIENKIDDIVSIFSFLKPEYLKTTESYSTSQIKKKIEPYFLRREKKDVFKDLPKKVKNNLWLELDAAQKQEYDEIEKGEIEALKNMGTKVSSIHIFSVLTKLKQICNFANGKDTSVKTNALVDIVESVKSNNEKMLIFSQYNKQGVNKIEKCLDKYGTVVFKGNMTDRQRNYAIEKFRNDPEITIFLANVKVGGVGITLTEANYVVHFDHWWNPATMWQAEDRAHRKGQEKVVNVYSFWMKDTVEERIYTALKKKGLLFEDVVSGLSDEDIDKMIPVDEWLEILGVKTKDERDKIVENVKLQHNTHEIYAQLQTINPIHFEKVVRRFFVKLGYLNSRLTKASYDKGIDIYGSRNTIGGIEKIIVQCKRMEVVGANYARELYGVFISKPDIAKAYLVVSGKISDECTRFCRSKGNLVAIDGMTLAGYIKRYSIDLHVSNAV
jgi:SNF2 family DNA or RNA helicase